MELKQALSVTTYKLFKARRWIKKDDTTIYGCIDVFQYNWRFIHQNTVGTPLGFTSTTPFRTSKPSPTNLKLMFNIQISFLSNLI